jgi:hypothetical protein
MKKYLALLLFAFIAMLSFGQDEYQDVIYSKDGSITRGVIIDQVQNKYIRISTPDGKSFVYQMFEIEKVTKEPFSIEVKEVAPNTSLQAGFRQTIEVGYIIDAGSSNIAGKKVNIMTSYQINPFFSVGVGTGLRYYPDIKTSLIPLLSDFKVHFLNKKVSPYLAVIFGYSFNVSNNWEKTGALFNPRVGISCKVGDKSAINVGIGIEKQTINHSFGSYSDEAAGAGINFGFSF